MLIAARNAILAGGAALPYDAEVQYLQSDGGQYIDTGIEVYTDDGFDIAMRRLQNVNAGGLYFGNNTNNTSRFCIFGYYFKFYDANSINMGPSGGVTSPIDFRLIYNNNVKQLIVGSTTYSSTATITRRKIPNGTFIIGACRVGDTINAKSGKHWIYCAKVGVRDFIPVRVGSGSSAVGYMYDRVSGELFGNAGTGAFVIGPDASAANGGGVKRKCVRRSHRRSWRPSARFYSPRLWKEVA